MPSPYVEKSPYRESGATGASDHGFQHEGMPEPFGSGFGYYSINPEILNYAEKQCDEESWGWFFDRKIVEDTARTIGIFYEENTKWMKRTI